MKELAFLITLGGKTIDDEYICKFLSSIKKSQYPKYLIFRDDKGTYKKLIQESGVDFKKVIQIEDDSIKKIKKINILSKFIQEDFVKILDPDDLVNDKAFFNFEKLKDKDFIMTSMISFISKKKDKYYNFNFQGSNPSTIIKTKYLRGMNNFVLEYDNIFFEDNYRYIFYNLQISGKAKISFVDELFGGYRYHKKSSASEYSKRGKSSLFRQTRTYKAPRKDVKMIIQDIENYIHLLNENNIIRIEYFLNEILLNYMYFEPKEIEGNKIISKIARIKKISNDELIKQLKVRLKTKIKNERVKSNFAYYYFNSRKIDKERMAIAFEIFKNQTYFKEFTYE